MKTHSCCWWLLQSLQLVALIGYSLSDVFEECIEAAKQNQFVANSQSCSKYIFCDGDDSYDGECGDGDYFNELYQTCDPADIVECRLNNNLTTIATPSTPPTITTTTTAATSIAIATTSNSLSPTETTSTTAIPTTSSPPTTAASIATITDTINVSAACPSVDRPGILVFLPHPKACSSYFICFHGEPVEMHCSAMLHFDVRTGKCDYPVNVKCPLNYLKPKDQCQSHTIDVFPHHSNCNYFYYCYKGFLMLQQCPFRFGWDYERRACVALRNAKCFNNQSI